MTKALPRDRFEHLRRSLHMVTLTDLHASQPKDTSKVAAHPQLSTIQAHKPWQHERYISQHGFFFNTHQRFSPHQQCYLLTWRLSTVLCYEAVGDSTTPLSYHIKPINSGSLNFYACYNKPTHSGNAQWFLSGTPPPQHYKPYSSITTDTSEDLHQMTEGITMTLFLHSSVFSLLPHLLTVHLYEMPTSGCVHVALLPTHLTAPITSGFNDSDCFNNNREDVSTFPSSTSFPPGSDLLDVSNGPDHLRYIHVAGSLYIAAIVTFTSFSHPQSSLLSRFYFFNPIFSDMTWQS